MHCLRALVACTFLLGLVSVARADDQRDVAKAHFEVARLLYAKGDLKGALDAFKRSYAAAPVPELLYDIGLCEERLGDLARAIDTYHAFLAARPDSPEHPELPAHIAQLETTRIAPPPIVDATIALRQAPPRPIPVYKRWWLWTTVGVVVAGGVVGAVLGARAATHPALGFGGGEAK